MSTLSDPEVIRDAVRRHYALAITDARQQAAGCCGDTQSCGCGALPVGYDPSELADMSADAIVASFGCGNPLVLADLRPGDVVLDLGSGAGLDVILSAKRVAPGGKAYGLDMTDEMLEVARGNAQAAGVANVEFLKGAIEEIPLPDASIDVILSNCVITLSAAKDAVLREAFRVLRPGGRFAVADVVILGERPTEEARQEMALWSACISGALTREDYAAGLRSAGFEGIAIELVQGGQELTSCCDGENPLGPNSRAVSALVRAHKPVTCGCGGTCAGSADDEGCC